MMLRPLLVAASVLLAAADTTTTVNTSANFGTWDGWGTSLAWWAKAFGNQSSLADIFFTRNSVSFNGKTLPGLGLNIIRYNAGASSTNKDPDGDSMVVSPNIKGSRQIDAFWLDWTSTNPNVTTSWSWTVDANQRNMMTLAVARGANLVELFSNSPVWWMCYNLNPSGSTSGSADNLESWNYDQHAVYLANIAQWAAQHWGVTFTSVDAFNEPSASYWSATGTQEGCHFDVSTMSSVIGSLRTELNSRGLTNTIVSAADENTYDLATSTLAGLTSTAVSQIGRVNVHGYQYGGGRRDSLFSAVSAKGKKLWNSEYGESDGTGAQLVSNLLLDFVWLHPTAWVYWQVLDVVGWGLITADNDAKTIGAVSQKYFVLAQFTRHIRPGMRIIDSGSSSAVAAWDSAAKKLVVVAVNTAAAQVLTFDLSRFTTPGTSGALVQRWATQIGATSGMQYVAFNDTFLSGSKFSSTFAQNVIMSFEVANVVI